MKMVYSCARVLDSITESSASGERTEATLTGTPGPGPHCRDERSIVMIIVKAFIDDFIVASVSTESLTNLSRKSLYILRTKYWFLCTLRRVYCKENGHCKNKTHMETEVVNK